VGSQSKATKGKGAPRSGDTGGNRRFPTILASGSLAYDYLYTFPGVFQDSLLADTKGNLSVAFGVSDKAIHYGGCAGNIVFNAKLLKKDFLLLGIAGRDFGEYKTWLERHGINTKNVINEKNEYTSQATVVTDNKGQQITFFHPGASAKSKLHVSQIKKTIKSHKKELTLAIVSPNDKAFMLASMTGCKEAGVPYFFDPGQAMPAFNKKELTEAIKHAVGVFLNEYEFSMIQKLTGLNKKDLLKMCQLFIATLGDKGSVIYFKGKKILIKPVKAKVVKDPTGCGDAYRAGFLIGIEKHLNKMSPAILENAGKLGTKLALACLGAVGTQSHKL
jgi:adenosine kinase